MANGELRIENRDTAVYTIYCTYLFAKGKSRGSFLIPFRSYPDSLLTGHSVVKK